MQNGQGTKNLQRGVDECETRRGVQAGTLDSVGAQQTLENSVSSYTQAAHRALIALRCAVSKRPFNFVTDPHYIAEVQLLRPGVIIPNPRTVARDVSAIYLEGSKQVKVYFSVRLSFLNKICPEFL
ncbi:uncharacterized protein EDB91DRAFT_1065342 [Suillus paluster]|uniref:uncharacterized protein n=1 Tax=Suillus paluster TaxID=48578 RepID=UPI001B87DD29|nr:uncharacterized protein EDB91DRAFT_1065342 [Suillus paluster]KAG1719768.1 hypothetical protein EDB91DRAFT_1065342 [Suillus paluster]